MDMNKNIVTKDKWGSVRKDKKKGKIKPEISENKTFLIKQYNSLVAEIKKISEYLSLLNHDFRIIKQLLNEVK